MDTDTYRLSQFFAESTVEQKTAVLLEICHRSPEFLLECVDVAIEAPYMKDVKAALVAEKKIDAIKIYRGATGASLKDSKDAVEAIQTKYGLHYTKRIFEVDK